MLDRDPRRLENIERLVDYLYKEFIRSNKEKFKHVLETNDKVREEYFKVVVQLIEVLVRSETSLVKEDRAIRWLVTDTALADTPNLPNEFYKKLFATRMELSKASYLDYFKSSLISAEDKAETMRVFLNQYVHVPASLAEMLEDFLIEPRTIPNLTLEGLFNVLAGKYILSTQTLDEFIKRLKKCALHRHVLSGINRVSTTSVSPATRQFLENNHRHYFVDLYYQLVDFVKHTRQDLLIEYINIPDYLNGSLVRYLESFKEPKQVEFSFGLLIQKYHERLNDHQGKPRSLHRCPREELQVYGRV
jgi:hypothetical protein